MLHVQSCFFAIRPIVVVFVVFYYIMLYYSAETYTNYWKKKKKKKKKEKKKKKKRNTVLYNYMIPYTTTDKTDRYMEYLRFSITLEFA